MYKLLILFFNTHRSKNKLKKKQC